MLCESQCLLVVSTDCLTAICPLERVHSRSPQILSGLWLAAVPPVPIAAITPSPSPFPVIGGAPSSGPISAPAFTQLSKPPRRPQPQPSPCLCQYLPPSVSVCRTHGTMGLCGNKKETSSNTDMEKSGSTAEEPAANLVGIVTPFVPQQPSATYAFSSLRPSLHPSLFPPAPLPS